MPTGQKHSKFIEIPEITSDPDEIYATECRCTIGEDHYEGDEGPASERISSSDAEDIWLSSGMDEDYDFR